MLPLKSEVLAEVINTPSKLFTKEQVKELVTSVKTTGMIDGTAVSKIKKGDVISLMVAQKRRPCVVCKVEKQIAWYMSLSSTEDYMNVYPSKSRFLGNGWFSKQIGCCHVGIAMSNFIGVYDNPKHLNKAIKALKQEIQNI